MSDWVRVSDPPTLVGDAVHVWRASLRVGADRLAELRALLSEDELARADRYLFEHSREQSIVSRATLRHLLAAYSGRDARSLVFDYGPKGRPLLDEDAAPAFNVSHSGDIALFAFTRRGELGVDVERIEPDRNLHGIAQRFFSVPERQTLASLEAADVPLAFYRCWTRKESYLKARGTGLSLPLEQFDVTLAPDAEPRLAATRFDVPDTGSWSLAELAPGDGYIGALITSGDDPRPVRQLRAD